MSTTSIRLVRFIGGLAAACLVSGPVLAGDHGGGFHGGGGGFHGGAHGFSGGSHFAANAFHGGYSGGGQRFVGAGHGYASSNHAVSHFAAPRYGVARYGAVSGYTGGHYGHSYAPGVYYGGYGHRPVWGGGYWHGRFWPGAYYRSGFSWFLPILPVGYLTLWWGGLPYYYWDDAYYLWSPQYRGYVVTDPPPAADGGSDSGVDQPASGGSPDLYVYPRNGQSESQTATDRFECHQWAVGQSGFDPSGSSNPSGSSESNYQRAITACLDARGYSAR